MSKVYPRRRGTPRPQYLPTAVVDRLSQPVLPSDTLSEWDRRKLEGRGIDRDFLDSLLPDVVRVRMRLPAVPVPETKLSNYKPPQGPAGKQAPQGPAYPQAPIATATSERSERKEQSKQR